MDAQKYLNRIAFTGPLRHDYDTLSRLQSCHLHNVPYENLDIVGGIPLKLDTQSLYDKIVTRRRGGYCFELNGLFGALLRALGFETHDHMARFLLREPSTPMRRHRVLRVVLGDAQYVCDVGVGIVCPTVPVRLQLGTVQGIDTEQYRVEWDDFLGYIINQRYRGEWNPFYAFTLEPQVDIDYVMPSFYCEKHPDSPFKNEDMLAICTPYGGKSTVSGSKYVLWNEKGRQEREITNQKEKAEALREYFGIAWY